MKKISIAATIMIAGIWAAGAGVHAAPVDHSLYASLLSRHVKDGVVDYQGFKDDEAILDRYLGELAAVDPEPLSTTDQFAFYVNAYNAWTIKLILSRYPGIRSIKDLGTLFTSPWKKAVARIDGGLLTLDQIEHDILRKRFKDPRVHFAVNCASKSCPPLLSEPYDGDTLEVQLSRVTRDFINDPSQYRIDGNIFWVSSIFKWFSEDFNRDVVGFYLRYAQGDLKKSLEARHGRLEVKYMDYDWSLNGY